MSASSVAFAVSIITHRIKQWNENLYLTTHLEL
jgi:hypothetical protein